MRTTVRIDDDLLRQLKERAERDKSSLTSTVNQAIRDGLRAKPQKRKRFVQKTHDMGPPLIDITKATSLAFALEDEAMLRKMGFGE